MPISDIYNVYKEHDAPVLFHLQGTWCLCLISSATWSAFLHLPYDNFTLIPHFPPHFFLTLSSRFIHSYPFPLFHYPSPSFSSYLLTLHALNFQEMVNSKNHITVMLHGKFVTHLKTKMWCMLYGSKHVTSPLWLSKSSFISSL